MTKQIFSILLAVGIFIATGCDSKNNMENSEPGIATIPDSPDYTSIQVDSVVTLPLKDEFIKPEFDASGNYIIMTKEGYAGIYLLNTVNGEVQTITDNMGTGYHRVITGERIYYVYNDYVRGLGRLYDLIKYDIGEKSSKKLFSSQKKIYNLKVHKGKFISFMIRDSLRVYNLTENKLVDPASAGVVRYIISGKKIIQHTGVQKAEAVFVADKNIISVNEYSPATLTVGIAGEGLIRYEIKDSNSVFIGEYNSAIYNSLMKVFAYTLTENDGYRTTKSILYISNPEKNIALRLTSEPGGLEENPAWLKDGTKLVFNTFDGQLKIAYLSYR